MARQRLVAGVVRTKLARHWLAHSRRCVRFAEARSPVAPFCTGRSRTAASNAQTLCGTGSSPATTWADPSPRVGAPLKAAVLGGGAGLADPPHRVGRLGGGADLAHPVSCTAHPSPAQWLRDA